MRDLIIDSTLEGLPRVISPRFFASERGYAAALSCHIIRGIEDRRLMTDGRIVEMEYQKLRRHHMEQRPDIIFHIPTEYSQATPMENNYAVWALKRQADDEDALDDFWKLDQMFEQLHYPLGFFINVDSQSDKLEVYNGSYADRLIGIAVWLEGGAVKFRHRLCHQVKAPFTE